MKPKLQHWLIALPALALGSGGASAADDLSGKITNLRLSEQLIDTVAAALPESKVVDAAYLDSAFDPNIRIGEDAQVGISFIDEGAGFRNSFGYFTYNKDTFAGVTRGDIDRDGSGTISLKELKSLSGVSEVSFVFNNASEVGGGGLLRPGDSVVLGGGRIERGDTSLTPGMEKGTVFKAGTNVGFFLGADTWNGKSNEAWDSDAVLYYSIDFLNPEAARTDTIADASELSRHVAMGFASDDKSDIIVGFEDLNRATGKSDEDFNDLVFRVWTDPVKALQDSNVDEFYTYAAPSPLIGQGAPGIVALMGSLLLWRRHTLRQVLAAWWSALCPARG